MPRRRCQPQPGLFHMKTTLRILAAALVVASASVAQAQGGGGGGGGGGNPAAMAERQAAARAALFEGITLTADQKTKIDTIYAQSQKASMDFRATITQGTPPTDEQRAKLTAITTDREKAIKAVLTPEQVVIYDKNYAARPQGRRGGLR
jgi:Spy/CpxP family protein refolding chaperone